MLTTLAGYPFDPADKKHTPASGLDPARAEALAGLFAGQEAKSAAEKATRLDPVQPVQPIAAEPPAGRQGAGSEALQKSRQATTLFLAQQAAQSGLGTAGGEGSGAAAWGLDGDTGSGSNAVADFRDFMRMTPEERLFDSILNDMGLTKEELAALPPEERIKIEQEIREKIEKLVALKAPQAGQQQEAA